MNRSTDRILCTHVGSLPRPPQLLRSMTASRNGKTTAPPEWERQVSEAVADVVRRQIELGIDIVDDGEMSKPSFSRYVTDRLKGFEPDPGAQGQAFWAGSREELDFPDYYGSGEPSAPAAIAFPAGSSGPSPMVCTGRIAYTGHRAVRTDIENLRAALQGADVRDAFIPAVSPAQVEYSHRNSYYGSQEEFLFAIADALREEYSTIAAAGFMVQIDDPILATYYTMNPRASVEQCRAWAAVRVDALNHALRGFPRDRVRFHTCYSIDVGPRVHDMQLTDVVDLILKVNAGAYSFEAANPRHEHEWRVWEDVTLPEDTVLIPGVVTQSTVLVEHPELVAQRIERFASVVGRERVIAGADCGFSTVAGSTGIPPTVAWAKLASIAEGARLASKRLWR
jgi:5-methyltetrahydropteroyltriglutamate--homocysteine methyltransferase